MNRILPELHLRRARAIPLETICMEKRQAVNIRYIGGPTAWIEFCGLRFLTDPTFDAQGTEYTTGPVTLRKLVDPPVAPEELGAIDFVLLSHDQHSDNLDHAGRQMLPKARTVLTTKDGAERIGNNAVGLVPWQTIRVRSPAGEALLVTATPARHGPTGCEDRSGPVIGFAVRKAGGVEEETLYVSGDTVWYEGVGEVARWFRVRTAVVNMGAARVEAAGPAPLTMTAQDGVMVARAMPDAAIVPLHFEGWAHFSESRHLIERVFHDAGLQDRLRWAEPWMRRLRAFEYGSPRVGTLAGYCSKYPCAQRQVRFHPRQQRLGLELFLFDRAHNQN